ncbi:MAG: ester cyclase [Nitrospira sp.]|nr:ester cyclase [Nitrospira sp.]
MTHKQMTPLRDFAVRYTAAWCSRKAVNVAQFFAPGGSLTINRGTPSVGRSAITTAAQGFFTAFPDLTVYLDDLVERQDKLIYQWTLEGTHSRTGKRVRLSGFEEWTMGNDGLIAASLGNFDVIDLERQIEQGVTRQ